MSSATQDANTEATRAWHTLTSDEVLSALNSGEQGLQDSEAEGRLKEWGPNRLPPPSRRGPLVRFLLQFHNVLIYILFAAGALKFGLEKYVDAGVIFGVIFVNAAIGFFQEGRAEKALDALRKMLSLEATVIRGGKRKTVPSDTLVPGDIVLLGSGDKVPADIRLIETNELKIEEAMLTGESIPADKDTSTTDKGASLGDRHGLAFSGTLVTSGRGKGIVVATGEATELGKVNKLVATTDAIATPLIRKVNHFAHRLAIVIAVLAMLTIGVGYFVGSLEFIELVFAAIALAVAAIPEGLPAIMTIVLAIGVRRMAARHAIIRRLQAVDTLGALTVVCSDKTGTLTRNEMVVTHLLVGRDHYVITGSGYEPKGEFQRFEEQDKSVDVNGVDTVHGALLVAALCNEGGLKQDDTGTWCPLGDPMEGALLAFAAKGGITIDGLEREWPTVDMIPFESSNQFMASLHSVPAGEQGKVWSGEQVVLVKGAPERLIGMCSSEYRDEQGAQAIDSAFWEEQADHLASQGQRVLALAFKSASDSGSLELEDVKSELTLLGLVGIIDPPRDEAIKAVEQCRSAGIRVVMITGDHATTARAIGMKLGIGDGKTSTTGKQIDTFDNAELRQIAKECDVFARVSPEHKLRLVEAIQSHGEVVAMTGDGVNDAPALKRADVGIAMGIKGTEVTKEAAEMVLTDDNFASIAQAVEEGRTVFDNIRKSLLFILPTNGGEAMVIFAAIIFGLALPLTPLQVLWVNMITAVTLALALAFEPPESNVMKRPPRDPNGRLLTNYFLFRIAFVSTIMCIGTFLIFTIEKGEGMSIAYAQTTAVNTIVMFEVFYLFNTRFIQAPVLNRNGLFGSKPVWISIGLVVVFQLMFTYLPPLQAMFGTEAISWQDWVETLLIASSVLWLVEIEKWIVRCLQQRKPKGSPSS
ncbi:cation-translocating P-type ATPase [Pirellulaceae bacterium SH449]